MAQSAPMFETVEVGRKLGADDYEREVAALRTALLKAQTELGHSGAPVIVLLHGVDPVGTNEVFNLLHEWLDARYLVTHAWEPATDDEHERPEYWRYWQWLPPKGELGIFLGSWYTKPLLDRARGKMGQASFDRELARAASFERTLFDDGTSFVKFWLHVTKHDQKAHLDDLSKSKKTRYRVSRRILKEPGLYRDVLEASGRLITRTSVESAPWTIVEAADRRYRDVYVGRELLRALEEHLALHREGQRELVPVTDVPPEGSDPVTVLDTLDLSKQLSGSEYKDRLTDAQNELARLAFELEQQKRSVTVLFEGWDAAGKGGAIRRISTALDAHQYRIISIAAPTEEERAHHYLWRFWRHLPRTGRFTIYDRSWYGRVLVERVEGFAGEHEWRRAYKELNDFEEQLVQGGSIVVKYWLHISQDEQLRRFEARKTRPWKEYKLTDEDFRNRRKTGAYELAANEMVARTSTAYAPWTLVEAEDKRFARVKVVETLCERMRDAL